MKLSYRLTMLLVSLGIIIAVGWFSTRSLEFATGHFWFIAGALLLVMLSLVDQPHFSKDANVFVNGATALVSLFAVAKWQRTGLWWVFCSWALYLVIASFALMALRSRELFLESKSMQFFSRLNRVIGRPESIFSAFFLWGVFLQFNDPKDTVTINTFFLFWAVFMILNVPGIAQATSGLFARATEATLPAGVVTGIHSPRVALVKLSPRLPDGIVGRHVSLTLASGEQVARGTVIEDRIACGLRLGRIALTSFGTNWRAVSSGGQVEVAILDSPVPLAMPVGVVSAGSSIAQLVFDADPRTPLRAGEVVHVRSGPTDIYYQIVSAVIGQASLDEENTSLSVKVSAGQLGTWDRTHATFTPVDWVAPAGELVALASEESTRTDIPSEHCLVGTVPKSRFPVHINIPDAITHNTAIIGVTGSGKSYLAFHVISAMVNAGVKVLILDISRQHDLHLSQHNPYAITTTTDVQAWLKGDCSVGIHQFGANTNAYPKVTADFVAAAFAELSQTKLERGKNIPPKLCVVLEEAHALVPEWNQVAEKGDQEWVNKTARVILQGRKYGMGVLVITQRTANVTKTILNQCNTVFALRSYDQTGLDFLKNYMGEEYSQAISTLPRFTAVLVGQASSSSRPIIVKISDFNNAAAESDTPT